MTDRPYAALGRRIQDLMTRERLNQGQLAAKADISPSYPSKVISGEKRPSFQVLVRIANALKGDIDELAFLAGYGASRTSERPDLPGWQYLDDADQVHIRSLVARLSELNRGQAPDDDETSVSEAPVTQTPSSGPRRPPPGLGELVALYGSLPPAFREALLEQARDTKSTADGLAERLREASPPRSRPGGRESA